MRYVHESVVPGNEWHVFSDLRDRLAKALAERDAARAESFAQGIEAAAKEVEDCDSPR